MVNKTLKMIMLLALLLPTAVLAETCTTDWSCTGWSECAFTGNMVRLCEDLNNCGAEETPTEIKDCDDTKDYEPVNTDVEIAQPSIAENTGQSDMNNTTEESIEEVSEDTQDIQKNTTPNRYIGYGIILMFILAGFLIGKYIIRKKR